MAKAPTQAGGGVQAGSTTFKTADSGPDRNIGSGNALPGNTWQVSGPIATGTYNPDWNKTPETQTPQTDAGGETAEQRAERLAREERERIEGLRRMNAEAVLGAQMEAYGLGGLSGQIKSWIQEGYEPDAIMALVRQSQEYANRFPAMKILQQKGRSISEAEYINYEQSMAQYEKLFGLPQGMLTDKDMVTKLIGNEVSAREMEERATKASAAMYQLPKEYRDMMRNYYGVDSGGLTAYFLDPDVAAPLLERQFVSAQIGMEAQMRGVGVGKGLSESLYERGVTRDQAADKFTDVAAMAGLSYGKGDTASQDQRIGAAFQLDQQSQDAVQRAAGSRKGRFEGGSAFVDTREGIAGLGSSSR